MGDSPQDPQDSLHMCFLAECRLVYALLFRGAVGRGPDMRLLPASQVGFETEGTAIFDTMCYVQNEVRPPVRCLSVACIRASDSGCPQLCGVSQMSMLAVTAR